MWQLNVMYRIQKRRHTYQIIWWVRTHSTQLLWFTMLVHSIGRSKIQYLLIATILLSRLQGRSYNLEKNLMWLNAICNSNTLRGLLEITIIAIRYRMSDVTSQYTEKIFSCNVTEKFAKPWIYEVCPKSIRSAFIYPRWCYSSSSRPWHPSK